MTTAGRALRASAFPVLWAAAGMVVTILSAALLEAPFFMFQFAAVVGAALQGGFGAGCLTMVLSGLGFYALYFAPTLEGFEAFRLGAFALVSLGFAWLAARMRRARVEAEAAKARAEAAEAEAKAIGAQQERLVAVVSHDLRNPLSAISVTAQALGLDALDRQAKGLKRIDASARRMQSMIGDLLDFARARQGTGLRMQRRPARLGEICRSAIEEVRASRPTRAIVLEVIGDDGAALDPGRVEQVVSNLVSNALAHGAADAPVRVTVRGDGAALLLEVANQGAPIPPHLMATLFSPFRPGDAPGSVGLGLFIVDQIARAHGGHTSAASGGRETTITVTFPRDIHPTAPGRPSESPSQQGDDPRPPTTG